MNNTYLHEGYCDLASKEEKTSDRLLIGGVYAVAVILFSLIYWYAVSQGIYIDPISL